MPGFFNHTCTIPKCGLGTLSKSSPLNFVFCIFNVFCVRNVNLKARLIWLELKNLPKKQLLQVWVHLVYMCSMLPNFDPFLIIWDFQGSDCFNISCGSKERFMLENCVLTFLLCYCFILCWCLAISCVFVVVSFCVFVVLSHFLVLLAVSLCFIIVRPFLSVTQRKKAICHRLPDSHAGPDLCWWS